MKDGRIDPSAMRNEALRKARMRGWRSIIDLLMLDRRVQSEEAN
jgi:hypothetical protein